MNELSFEHPNLMWQMDQLTFEVDVNGQGNDEKSIT